MNALRLALLAPLALVLTACPAEETAPPAFEEPTPAVEEPALPPAAPETAELQDIAGTGVSGQVMAMPRDDRTEVTVSVMGGPANESLGARIHSGTCESPGPELARLDAISTSEAGQGQSVTNVGHAPHLILDGNHIAAVYAPGTEPERDMPIACTTLPASRGGTATTTY
jgi:hypothetical protein